MLQITGSGKLVVDQENLPRMRDIFTEQQLLKLPKLIEPSILKRVLDHVENAEFFSATFGDQKRKLGEETRLSPDNPAIRMMSMMLNNPALFQVVEQITGCSKIRSYLGRIRRESPNTGNFVAWHMDPNPDRLIGISINLSTAPYAGGVFQLRDKTTERMLAEVANTGFGDAIIFQIARGFQHRVTEVVGTIARTTCAGWFYSQPDVSTLMGFDRHKK
jgi:hypothetical protein